MERLHTLLKLSEAGSLIRAANNDIGQQSRLSHHLRELSEFFGVDLTERSGKTIKLTPAGEALVRVARQQFSALQAFRNEAANAVPTFQIAAGDSVTQWLLVPAIARMRRPGHQLRFQLFNLRTKDIVDRLKDGRVEFGILRDDALQEPLLRKGICEQRYAIVVPQRLVPTRGLLTLKAALLICPHAAISGDGQLMERLRDLAQTLGGKFIPELACDSIGQCVAAVETGAFAAVLPVQAWKATSQQNCIVVEDEALNVLSRRLVMAWHPRTLEVKGQSARKVQQGLLYALTQASEAAGAPKCG